MDRINNVQTMLCYTDRGEDGERVETRRCLIHPDAQPLIKGLSGLTYKEGTSQPNKGQGYDHMTDALGYLLWQEFNQLAPARRPVVRTLRI